MPLGLEEGVLETNCVRIRITTPSMTYAAKDHPDPIKTLKSKLQT